MANGKKTGGRLPGSLNKKTVALIETVEATGKTPLEVMLMNMRHFQKVAEDAEAVLEAISKDDLQALGDSHEQQFKAMLAKVKSAAGLRQMAVECARDAAPFIHAKLATIEHRGELTVSKVIRAPATSPSTAAWAKDNVPPHLRPTEH